MNNKFRTAAIVAICVLLLVGCSSSKPSDNLQGTVPAEPTTPSTPPPSAPDPVPPPIESNWVMVTPPNDVALHDVIWHGGRFVAVGSDTVIVSSDGLNWDVVYKAGDDLTGFAQVSASSGGYIATFTGMPGHVVISADGSSWAPHAVDRHARRWFNSVAYDGERTIMVSANIQRFDFFHQTEDGVDWENMYLQNAAAYRYTKLTPGQTSVRRIEVIDGEFYFLFGDGTILVAGGELDEFPYMGQRVRGYLVREMMLENDHSVNALAAGYGFATDSTSPRLVVSTNVTNRAAYDMFWSDNGSEWHQIDYSGVGGSRHVMAIHWTGDRFLAGGVGVMSTSQDGIVWVEEEGVPNHGGSVARFASNANGVIVAVSYNTNKPAIYTYVPKP